MYRHRNKRDVLGEAGGILPVKTAINARHYRFSFLGKYGIVVEVRLPS
jgi:hypothetical protein